MNYENLARELVTTLQAALIKKSTTVATAESCTGGLLAAALTMLPGSSASYLGGVSAYANTAKLDLLKVPREVLSQKGAVSADVAKLMAQNSRKLFKSTYGVSVTGIAGPGGGTADKPIGTVFIGVSTETSCRAYSHRFEGDRTSIRAQATLTALKRTLELTLEKLDR